MAAASPPRDLLAGIVLGLAVLISGVARFQPIFRSSFLSDDYLILDKVWHRTFVQLWWRDLNLFGWYRPWSRELHFWVLYKLAGLQSPVYHAVSLVLWLVVLALFGLYVWREAGATAAAIATAGLAGLASWGAPLAWIAGCQELWLCIWALCYLHALAARKDLWAFPALLLALLSKETAIGLPLIGAAYVALVRRDAKGRQLMRAALDGVITLAWLAWHPMLIDRLLHGNDSQGDRLATPALAIPYSLLSFVNLEVWPHPEGSATVLLLQGLLRYVPLIVAVVVGTRRGFAPWTQETTRKSWFACAWLGVALAGMLTRTIGWHAYYAILGALAAWYLLGLQLQRQRWLAVAVVALVAVLEPVRAETPSWDWASLSYQRRAMLYCGMLRNSLVHEFPSMSPHTRLYFADIPQNTGFVTADGPAFRVIYRDSTLHGWFIGRYRARASSEPRGEDLFLRFDGEGLRRMVPSAPPPSGADPDSVGAWESDQRLLAWTFGHGGDWQRAGDQFASLDRYRPQDPEYATNASACYQRAGDRERAQVYADRARGTGARQGNASERQSDAAQK